MAPYPAPPRPTMTLLPYRLSLFALLLAITLPFLGAHHYLPIATFHQEWLAGMLGLASLLPLALVRDSRPWEIPRTALLPLALIILVWVQFATNNKVLFESVLLLSLYMAWAFALMLAACRIETMLGRECMADTLAWGLLTGALLLALTGALQRWAPWIDQAYIFRGNGNINGNVAQANSFADYLWIGIASALYLNGRDKLSGGLLWLLLPALIGFSLMSGSRSVYFFAAALSTWLGLWAWLQPGTNRKSLIFSATLLLPMLLFVQWLIENSGTPVSSAQRLLAQGSYDSVRLTLWRAAFSIFSEHPLLGAGFDSFSREFFEHIAQFPINGAGIPEHSHNLLTEMLAEFGLAGFGLVLGAGVLWLSALRRHRGDSPVFLALGVLLVLGIHSGLEYPLWYAHFLAIAVLMLTLGEGRRWSLTFAPRYRLALAGIALAGGVVLLNLRGDYMQLEAAAQGHSSDGQFIPAETQRMWLLNAYSKSLWRHYAALQFAARMPIEARDTEARVKVMEEALHFSPIRQGAFRYAALLQLNGQHEAASAQLKRAMLAYPGDIAMVEKQFAALANDSPELGQLKPLIEQLRQRSF